MSKPTIIRQYGDTDFITTLRAIAATMVVIHHTSGLAGLGWIGYNFSEVGKYGVQIFFVISGFTIAKTFLSAPNYKHFILRRLFRIAPIYYVSIILGSLLVITGYMRPVMWLTGFKETIDIYNLGMHFLFLSFLDYTIAQSIIGVEWSIPVEVFWYAVLPAIILQLTSIKKVILILLCIMALNAGINLIATLTIGPYSQFIMWVTPLTYAIYFMGGVAAYKIREDSLFSKYGITKHLPLIAFGVFLIVTLLRPELFIVSSSLGISLGMCTFLVIAFFEPSKSVLANRIATFKPFLFLGSISYSIYLAHFIILMVLQAAFPSKYTHGIWTFLVVYILTAIISTITYYYIEKPTNRLGRSVADKYFVARNLSRTT